MPKLDDFLKDYDNPSTKSGYRSAVYGFIKFVYKIKTKDPRNTLLPDTRVLLEKQIDKYLSEKRDNKADLMNFRTSMKDRPPLSQRQTINLVNEFLSCNNIVIPHADIKRVRRKIKGGVATQETDFDIEIIRKILRHMDVKGRALCYTLISSGMRIGECLQIRDSDIDLTSVPAKITIRPEYTKSKQGRVTFITPQAVDALREWMSTRQDYLNSSNGKNAGLIAIGKSRARENNGNHLFPFSDNTANLLFDTAITNAGLMTKDETTGRSQIHVHMTRKFFISQMSLLVSKEIPETLVGHASNMSEAYRRYPVKQLADEYLKCQHLLTITDEQELKSISTVFDNQMQKHSRVIADSQVEIR
jgi:integrase